MTKSSESLPESLDTYHSSLNDPCTHYCPAGVLVQITSRRSSGERKTIHMYGVNAFVLLSVLKKIWEQSRLKMTVPHLLFAVSTSQINRWIFREEHSLRKRAVIY